MIATGGLKKENMALRKENKHLKALLQDALVIIRKLKEHVDTIDSTDPDDHHESPAKPKKLRKAVKKK